MSDEWIEKDLCLYGQEAWHGDAYIIGTKVALEALRDAVQRAIDNQESVEEFMVASDGEGYYVRIRQLLPESMGLLMNPYTDEVAADTRDESDLVMPWDVCEYGRKEPDSRDAG